MPRLSLLLFSRNHNEGVFSILGEMHGLVDEVVLVDSSDAQRRKELHEKKSEEGWSKLKIFYIIPTGLVETSRMYGLGKCTCEWVFYLDADEKANEALKKDIRKIVSGKTDGFVIKRYEYVKNGAIDKSFFTWNTRLYRKAKASYLGIVHEQAHIDGRVERLDEKYHIINTVEYKNPLTGNEYSKLLKLERMSYGSYNKIMLDQVGKVVMPESGDFTDTRIGKAVLFLLRSYETLTSRSMEEELSDFDYYMYNTVKYIVFFMKAGDFGGLANILNFSSEYVRRIRGWKEESDGKEIFEISKIIYKEGIISFLGLNNENRIMELNRKYKDGKVRGADLLLKLLKEEYARRMLRKV